MNQKPDSTKLQILSETNIERMNIEVRRIAHLYQARRIRGIRAHEMLHGCTKDINTIFWQVSAEIGKAHQAIDNIHKINTGSIHPDGRGYLSKRTCDAIQEMLVVSYMFRSGKTEYVELRKSAKIAQGLMKTDVRCLCQDIRDLLYRARKYEPQEPESIDTVTPEEMLIKKVSESAILKPVGERSH